MSRLAKIILATTLSITPLVTFSQIGEPRSNIAFGVSTGINLNSVTFNPSINQTRLITPSFGAALRITSEKYFSMYCALQVELNYARLGWKEDIIDMNSQPLPDKYKRELDYLQIPLLARLSWGKETNGPMIYFIAGPQLGYCIGEREKRSDTWTTIDIMQGGEMVNIPNRPNNLYEQYGKPIDRKFDYGITAGLGVELNTKVGHFMIEGRYYFGLADIFDNGKKDLFARSAHGTIAARITYMFDIRK